jgi:3-oxoacyl-(acyl-carrier-protein) synthase
LLAREGAVAVERIHPGGNFERQRELVRQLDAIGSVLKDDREVDLFVASANGTFIDAAEERMAAHHFPQAAIYAPKASLGESVAAGGLWQVVCAALALRRQEWPATLGKTGAALERAVVTTCGMNQQVAGLTLAR